MQSLTDTLPAIISAKVLTDGDLQSLQWSMGDGATYSTTLPNILHTYKSSGTYTISVLATDQTGKKAEASTKVYIAPGSNLFYQLAIQPTFTFQNGGVEYHFSVASQGDLDRVVWSFNTPEVRETPIGGSITQTFSGTTMVVVHAKAYAQGALKAVASTNIFPSATPRFASLQVVAGSLQVPTKVTTTLAGLKMQSVQNILRDRGDGMITSGTELTVTHLYTSSGIKTLRQTLFLQDAQPLENIITFFVENPFASHSVALNIVGTQFSYPQAQPVKFTLSLLSRSPAGLPTPIRIANTFAINQSQTFSATPLSKIVLQYVYPDAGTKSITSFGEINRCVSLFNQGTVYISAEDRCLAALKNGRLTQYQCDMDSDGIPDLCDDDLDGDGKKNLLGLVKYEKADCSYDNDNVDGSILRKHFGVCSLDNCPFVKNADQSDLNNNGIGEVCEAWTKTIVATPGETDTLWKYDQDKDGIPDDVDLCPTIPGDRVHQGCPSF
ncbi:MAG: PKD domain-containing protein [Candidatus Peribacteria bacterium]|nr:PKD domain-containing protein [Candidatus Peribacteria bacterium]